jgi:hypothetical protein
MYIKSITENQYTHPEKQKFKNKKKKFKETTHMVSLIVMITTVFLHDIL